jgi:hypothetical protein
MCYLRLLGLVLLISTSQIQAREWTAKDGRKLEADFVSLVGNKVTLRPAGGRTITILLTLLSPADQQWIKSQSNAPAARPPEFAAGKTYVCDFQSDDWSTAWNLGNPNLPRNFAVAASFPAQKSPAERALEITLKQGTHYGADFGYDFASGGGSEPEEAELRYRICFAADFNAEAVQGGKLPGFGGMYGDTGSAGRKVDGTDSWSARGAYWKPDAEGRIPIGFYVYHADMQKDFGDTLYFSEPLARGRWYEVRLYVKLNTSGPTAGAKGENNGVLRAWLDGRPVFERTDLRFRDVDRLKIRNAWFHFYHGGGQPASQDYKLWIDDVSIARPN